MDTPKGAGADLGQREELLEVIGFGFGVAPGKEPHLRVRVQRHVHGHLLLSLEQKVAERLRLGLAERPDAGEGARTDVGRAAAFAPLELEVAVDVGAAALLLVVVVVEAQLAHRRAAR